MMGETGMEESFEGGKLSSLLGSATRDFLVLPSGEKVKISELQGSTVGIYFAANWYSKCETFTPSLAEIYNFLKEQGSRFEIVFVSSDEDHISFDKFHKTMPWPAIPFNDIQSKRGLTRRYHIEGIPSLVILDPNGELIQADSVDLIRKHGYHAFPFTSEKIEELQAEEKAKHANQTLEKLLTVTGKDYVLSHTEQVLITKLEGSTVGLYFSACWCPPCAKFTSKLSSIYNSLKEKKKEFEIVYVSLDKDEAEYTRCYDTMPWLALPYHNEASKYLSRYFDVQGIPSLIIVGPDGKTVTSNGRNLINLHLEKAFPFTEYQLKLLQQRTDEEAKNYPSSYHHAGHRHVLKLVSENSGGGPYICCECEEQGLGWAYQCLDCGYEIHLKCSRQTEGDRIEKNPKEVVDSTCSLNNGF